MAYDEQIKCIGCGMSIPDVPEDASLSEMLCEKCHKNVDDINSCFSCGYIGHEGYEKCPDCGTHQGDGFGLLMNAPGFDKDDES